jgi:hypothetical protein
MTATSFRERLDVKSLDLAVQSRTVDDLEWWLEQAEMHGAPLRARVAVLRAWCESRVLRAGVLLRTARDVDEFHDIGGGKVVLVASQGAHGTVHVWTLEYSDEPSRSRSVIATGTGQPIPEDLRAEHIGSAIAGPFVWHVFAQVPF